MGNPSDTEFRYEHRLSDFNPSDASKAQYQMINPLQPSVTQEAPENAHRQAIRRHFPIVGILQILNPWRTKKEYPKIALHKGRSFAIIYFLSTLVPLVGAILLIIINARTTPLGYVSTSTVAGLQFVAKFLDILMQVTLARLALHLVRHQLLGPDPLPLGALLAPFRVSDASYLWSLDLWGSITSSALRGSYRIFFCIMIPLTVLLASVTGPSSAILVIPRRIQYINDRALVLFNESSTMYPAKVDLDSNGLLPGESQFHVLGDGILAYAKAGGFWDGEASSTPYQDASGTRLLSWADINDWGFYATIPTRLAGSFITTRRFDRQTDFAETSAMQPYSEIECNVYQNENQIPDDANSTFVNFGPNNSELNAVVPWSILQPGVISTDNTTFMSATYPQNTICETDGQNYAWNYSALVHKVPANETKYSSLFVVTSNNPCQISNETWAVRNASWAVRACTIQTVWSEYLVNTSATSQVAESYRVGTPSQPNVTVQLQPDFVMRMANLYMQQIDDTVLEAMLQPLLAVALAAKLPSKMALNEQGSLSFNGSSSNPAPSNYFTQQQIDAARSWIDKNKLLSTYSSIEIFGLNNWTDPSTLVQMDFKVYRSEYGYNSESVPVKLALVVFGVYVFVTALHVMYTFAIAETGTSWDSVADLLMLALNSRRPPPEVGATSVGADSIATFREPVNVRINERNTAELVFEKDDSEDKERLMRVQRNMAY